jgi:dihydroorotate dehydrogenase electron transfer subunit
MSLTDARVIERREIADHTVLLWLSAPDVPRGARPGQFVMVRPGVGLDPYLGRPFWIHRLRDGDHGEEFALLVEVVGRVTALLAAAPPGSTVRVFGPLGRPVTLSPGVRNLLLIGEGAGVAPLVWLADEEIARGRSVTLLLGAGGAEGLYPIELLAPEVELAVATDDGSGGRRGPIEELVTEYVSWADQIVACGPGELYSRLAATLRGLLWRRPCLALLQAAMPCGTGLCGDCVIATRRQGVKLVCRDGPAFDLRAIE